MPWNNTYALGDFAILITIFEYLREILPGISIIKFL